MELVAIGVQRALIFVQLAQVAFELTGVLGRQIVRNRLPIAANGLLGFIHLLAIAANRLLLGAQIVLGAAKLRRVLMDASRARRRVAANLAARIRSGTADLPAVLPHLMIVVV
jgi:hypothetical protein